MLVDEAQVTLEEAFWMYLFLPGFVAYVSNLDFVNLRQLEINVEAACSTATVIA
ncbi:hypothetical protein DPMN_041022 [Dreissena polymorpha]|uniref:Uncharacterized protein n=1 Tax=Dreissena polymorpha TaxID=45954 RepID=A0A9D4CZF9_DREPO|nr:hypothetical protein DPMN_041022 [Dreissena polymorpha]